MNHNANRMRSPLSFHGFRLPCSELCFGNIGVMVEHRSLVNLVTDTQLRCGFTSDDVFIQNVSVAFDPFMLDFFVPLSVGACVVPAQKRAKQDAAQFLLQLAEYKVTAVAGVPSEVHMWLTIGAEMLASLRLRWIILGGEPLAPVVMRAILQPLRGCQLLFAYGPTEVGHCSVVPGPRLPFV